MFRFKYFFLIFLSFKLIAASNFINPQETLSNISPNLSSSNKNAENPQITSSSDGKYVYAIWQREDDIDGEFRVQTIKSEDFGKTWKNPTSTPTGEIPNLSEKNKFGGDAQIATSSSGKYVYAIWKRKDSSNYYVIQVAISDDYGQNWKSPTVQSGNLKPNLSNLNNDSHQPQIATSLDGKYVYAIWYTIDSRGNSIVQAARSDSFGDNWKDPGITPGGSSPDLSVPISDARTLPDKMQEPQIKTDESGKYVCAVWKKTNNSNYIIQTAYSKNYGINWYYPTSTTMPISPNLSLDGEDALTPKLSLSGDGKYVHAIWEREDVKDRIQVVRSEDFGENWINSISTPSGDPPNLSIDGQDSEIPQIVTDQSGKYVCAVWERYVLPSPALPTIQVAISNDFGRTFKDPNVTPINDTPNLSRRESSLPYLSMDSTGKFLAAVWEKDELSGDMIQVAISSDFGAKWTDPSLTPGNSIPNLSIPNSPAINPRVFVSGDGKHTYAIWQRLDSMGNYRIQLAIGDLFRSFSQVRFIR